MVIDGSDHPVAVFLRRLISARRADAGGLVEAELADVSGGGGDFGADLLVGGNQQGGAMPDLGAQGLGLGLPRGPLCGAAAGLGIGDREVFVRLEPGLVGVGDGIQRRLFAPFCWSNP